MPSVQEWTPSAGVPIATRDLCENGGKLRSHHILWKKGKHASCSDADIYMQSEAQRLPVFVSDLLLLCPNAVTPFCEAHGGQYTVIVGYDAY